MRTNVVLKPRVSEKSFALSQSANTYVFDVPSASTKHNIARSVESQYKVKVESVRVTSVSGKGQRNIRRGRVIGHSKRQDIKKAYVTLAAGNSLPIFASEADEKKENKAKGSK